MERLSLSVFNERVKGGVSAEMRVSGVLRGGIVNNRKFYFHGSVSYGSFECELNSSLKIHALEKGVGNEGNQTEA